MKNLTALLSLGILCFPAGPRTQIADRPSSQSMPFIELAARPLLHESLFRPATADRQSCGRYYPLPDNYQNWTGCKKDGGSACGGPDQCACADSERLITFTCDQGTYHRCYAEKGNGCAGN